MVRTTVPFLVPESPLDLHPPAGNPSGIPAETVRDSDRFRGELTETSSFSGVGTNPENETHLKRNRLFCFYMSLNACPGATPTAKCPPPCDSQPASQIQQKVEINPIAPTLPKKMPANVKMDVQRVPAWTRNLSTTSQIDVWSRSCKGIGSKT